MILCGLCGSAGKTFCLAKTQSTQRRVSFVVREPMHSNSEKYRHRVIRASRFCSHYGIRTDRTITFSDVRINEEGILVLDLKTTTAIGKPKRA